jgi:glycosyltransferase involved in cell wall biosynthesis
VQGRRLVVDEQLELELDPSVVGAVSLSIGERSDRPLDVAVDTTHPCRASTVDVDGIAEWRSFWGPLTTVHQIDLEPASQIEFRWSVTPRLRVGSTIHGHPYDRGLYEALGPRVVDLAAGPDRADDVVAMRGLDVFHQHWPEWYSGDDPARAEATVATIRAAGIPLVWTQHNLLPHFTKEAGRDAYRVWAAAADAVIHHSHWGRDVALATYDYADDCVHEVVPHGHWGFRFDPHRDLDRATIEAMMGWEPAPIRLAVVGMPRAEKDIQLVLDAVAAVDRDDLQLVVRVGPDDVVPDDPRIVVETRHLDEAAYYRRLLAVDALVLPFASDGMLTTGTAFDALGGPLAVIASDWPFLAETFGDAALVYGHDREGLIELLTGLTPEALDASREAVARRAPAHDWGPIADRTLALFERLAGD